MINLIHGDCLELMKDIPDNSIDMVLTDPPYRLTSGGRKGKKTPRGGIFTDYNDGFKSGMIFKENQITFKEWIHVIYRILKPMSHALIMVNGRNLEQLISDAKAAGFKYKNILVWNKGNRTPNRNYMQQVEYILLVSKGGCRGINNMGCSNLINIPNQIGGKVHPTEKPVKLMELLISNSSSEGEVVLDCFMGSGSTGVACKNLNRRFIGIEKDEHYFKVAQKRIFGDGNDN